MTHRSLALKHGLSGSDCVLDRLEMSRSGTAQQSPQLLTAQQNTARRTPQVRPDQHKQPGVQRVLAGLPATAGL